MINIKKIVLASHNQAKINEFNALFTQVKCEVIPQRAFFTSEIAETGLTFVENAILKARYASQMSQLPALADDSGLEVDALQGAPGIYSARYAQTTEETRDHANNMKLLAALKDVPFAQRTACYRCVLVLMRHEADPAPFIAQAKWEGIILESPQGQQGFGYDPLFWLPEYQQTVAELPMEKKNQISHRAMALQDLYQQFSMYIAKSI